MPAGEPRPLVFLGPTLAVSEARRLLPAHYLPPAAQGDVITSLQHLPSSAVLLIDGVFQGEPAVRHKEILWAMARGIPVFGAASMGALRAAELNRYGMVGIGLIYRWYRRFECLPDDAVAVLHAPAELGFRALTLALVDLRLTIRRAERTGAIGARLAARLQLAAAQLNFRERNLVAVVDRALSGLPGEASRADIKSRLATAFVAQKKADAIAALSFLAAQGGAFANAGRCPPFTITTAFLRDLRHAGIELSGPASIAPESRLSSDQHKD